MRYLDLPERLNNMGYRSASLQHTDVHHGCPFSPKGGAVHSCNAFELASGSVKTRYLVLEDAV
jgi:hypothetical protein